MQDAVNAIISYIMSISFQRWNIAQENILT